MTLVLFLQLLLVKILLNVTVVTTKPATVSISTSSSTFEYLPSENDEMDINPEEFHRLALRNQSNLWPGGVIPYVIKDEYTQGIKNLIVTAMREIEDDVGTNTSKCIQFLPRTNEENYLAIRRGVGCHSYIGYWNNGVHYSTISNGCETKGIIMHELIHVLGFYHEQDRYDRDAYITINETNIVGGTAIRNFNKKSDNLTDTLGTPYDFGSIMHYQPYDFAKEKEYPVITPKLGYPTDINMGQRYSLSKWDVIDIQRLYGCPEDPSHIRSKTSGENVLVWCNFANGTCDLEQSVTGGGNQLPWVARYGPTTDGPIAGFSTGADSFLYASFSNKDENIQARNNPEDTTACKSSLSYSKNSSSGGRMEEHAAPQDTNEHPLSPFVKPSFPFTRHVASILTPFLIFDDDNREICIEFETFQPTSTSYLSIYLTGSDNPRVLVVSDKGKYKAAWYPVHLTATIPKGSNLRLEFEAVLTGSSVSLDDILVYKGACD